MAAKTKTQTQTEKPPVLLRYHERDGALWATLTRAHLEAWRECPQEYVGHARIKMAALKSDGWIQDFHLYPELLAEAWRKATRKPKFKHVDFLLAQGLPAAALSVRVKWLHDQVHRLGLVDIRGDRHVIARLPWRAVLCEVNRQLEQQGSKKRANAAQIYLWWCKAAHNGETVVEAPFGAATIVNPINERKVYRVDAARAGFVQLVIGAARECTTKGVLKQIRHDVTRQLLDLARAPGETGFYWHDPEHFERELADLKHGIAALGVQLPVAIGAGMSFSITPLSGDVFPGLPEGAGHWLCYVLFHLLALGEAQANPAWLQAALYLPIAVDNFERLLAVLVQRGALVAETETDVEVKWRPHPLVKGCGYIVAGEPPLAMFDHALQALRSVRLLQRHNLVWQTGDFLLIDRAQIKTLKDLVEEARNKLLKTTKKIKAPTQLWQLSWELIPLVRPTPKYIDALRSEQQAGVYADATLKVWVLQLARLENFRADPKWCAAKLIPAVDAGQIESVMTQLKEEGLLTSDPRRGRLGVSAAGERWLEEIAAVDEESDLLADSVAICREIPCTAREVGLAFLALEKFSDVSSAQEILNLCLERSRYTARRHQRGEEVYRLGFQLFKLTK